GKTSTMYRLGRELANLGWRVIATTTTMIRPPSLAPKEALVVSSNSEEALRLTKEALRQNSLITLAAQRLEAENKLKGIEPSLVDELVKLADAVIIEADGARGRSLKAPASYEPVIPAITTLLVPLVGIDAVGCILNEETVHRPQLVAELTGLALGEVIHASAIAKLLVHEQGALKGAPLHARVMPFINKVQDKGALATARQIARQIKRVPSLERVLIGAAATDNPVMECWRRVSAVVLAAGASKRFGVPKQLLPFAGKTMIEHVLEAVMATSVDEVVVVLGYAADQIMKHVPTTCRIVLNREWEEGIGSSIRRGIKAVDRRTEAALFVLADQPLISAEALEQILYAYYGTAKPIVASECYGKRGIPALFDRCLFPELEALQGDIGGRQIIARFPDQVVPVEVQSPEILWDVDTIADYERLLERNRHATP
ncbi:MAG: putative selenium-dependent hydroxylase accessory protein YqeC, partial [Chloroflexi bacterium]|nr:putative selenium-dependent hydroxylase accessory protein YqeC [Chloroflexota bacterium]